MKKGLNSKSEKAILVGIILLMIVSGIIIGKGIGNISSGKSFVTVKYVDNNVDSSSNLSGLTGAGADTSNADLSAGESDITSEREDGPQIIMDSDVLLKDDRIPIRFFDGEEIIALDSGIRYTCSNDCIEIVDDESGSYKCVKAKSRGNAVVTVEYNGKKASKTIYVHEESERTNELTCTQNIIIFSATADGSGAADFNVTVESDADKKMTAKFYLTDSRMGFTVIGEWVDDHTVHCKVENYLSRPQNCKMKIIVVEKGKPENLIGTATLQVDTPK